jgi:hypothetical protein
MTLGSLIDYLFDKYEYILIKGLGDGYEQL